MTCYTYSKLLRGQVLEATPVLPEQPATAVAIHRALSIGAQSTTRGVLCALSNDGLVHKDVDESYLAHRRKIYWRDS